MSNAIEKLGRQMTAAPRVPIAVTGFGLIEEPIRMLSLALLRVFKPPAPALRD